jgi:hypothetical protein
MVRGSRETHFEVIQKPVGVQVAIVRDGAPPPDRRYRITVTVPSGTPAGIINDRIRLSTDHPAVSVLEIPVYIFVSRARAG